MLANIITLAIVGVLFGLSIRKIVSDHKKGIPSCGMMCTECPSHGSCSTEDVPERFKAKNKDIVKKADSMQKT